MGTRSMINFADPVYRKSTKENKWGHSQYKATKRPSIQARVLKHWDGHPNTMMENIRTFFATIQKTTDNGDTRFDDASMLAARYVAFLGRMYERNYSYTTEEVTYKPMAFNSVRILQEDALDAEFRYTIFCNYPDRPFGSLPMVKIESLRGFEDEEYGKYVGNTTFVDPTDWSVSDELLNEILEPR